MTKDELITRIFSRLPFVGLITELDTTSEENAVRFKWRNKGYRVSLIVHVEEIGDNVLMGTDNAILMQALLERA